MRLFGMFVVCCFAGATNLAAQAFSASTFSEPAKTSLPGLVQPQIRTEVSSIASGKSAPAIKAQSTAVRFAKLLLPTTVGALAGSFAGFKAGDALGLGGSDSDGLQSAVLLGTTGGLLGAAAGSYLVVHDEISPGQLVHGVAIGALGGILGGALAGQASEDWDGTGVWLGFSLGQGIITSFILSQVAGGEYVP